MNPLKLESQKSQFRREAATCPIRQNTENEKAPEGATGEEEEEHKL